MTALATPHPAAAPRSAPHQPVITRPAPGGPTPWDQVRIRCESNLDPDQTDAAATARIATTTPSPRDSRAEPAELPDPGTWASLMARAVVEVLVGIRPATQLARWLTTDLYEAVARRAGLARRIHGQCERTRRSTTRRVRIDQVRHDAHEAAVVVHDGTRTRGVALRIEAHRGRWRITALEIG